MSRYCRSRGMPTDDDLCSQTPGIAELEYRASGLGGAEGEKCASTLGGREGRPPGDDASVESGVSSRPGCPH